MAFSLMDGDELVKILAGTNGHETRRLTFFLGAGCSVSSGIPAAGDLTKLWAQELAPSTLDEIKYKPESAARSYYKVFEKAYPKQEQRQQELFRLMSRARPGFGYVALARLICENAGKEGDRGRFPIVLTTNFDDLLEQAFLIHTNQRPIVISHHSLIQYAPKDGAIVKLHGDYRYYRHSHGASTRNLPRKAVPEKAIEPICDLLEGTELVFIGYSGYDPNVSRLIEACINNYIVRRIYWVNPSRPDRRLTKIFKGIDAWHIKDMLFDPLMLKMINSQELSHTSTCRLLDHIDRYHLHFLNGLQEIKEDKKRDYTEASGKFCDWFQVVHRAYQCVCGHTDRSHVERARRVFAAGLRRYRRSASLHAYYAHFMFDHGYEDWKIQRHFRTALMIDCHHHFANANYGAYLRHKWMDEPNSVSADDVRKHFEQAINSDPMDFNTMVNLTGFLFACGMRDAALNLMQECRKWPLSDMNRLEIDFYNYVYAPEEGDHNRLLAEIYHLLQSGVRPIKYRMEGQLRRTQLAAHPDFALAKDIATVMDGGDIRLLDSRECIQALRNAGSRRPVRTNRRPLVPSGSP